MAGTRRGRFVVLEGIDGAGTTTQAQRLVERIRAEGHRAHFTREPSDGPVGTLIRQILTGRVVAHRGRPVDAATVALLFAADRIDHLRAEIEPLLSEGVHVVSDRYLVSSLAYQGSELDPGWVEIINDRARPADLTVFLDVAPEVARERRRTRAGAEERFEGDEAQARVAATYRRLLTETPKVAPVTVVDGAPEADVVAARIWTEVAPLVR